MRAKLGNLSLGPRSPGRDGLNKHHPDYWDSGKRLVDHLIRHADLRPDSHILDIGCGTGRLAHALRSYLDGGQYHGIDIRADYVQACRKSFAFSKGYSFRHLDYYHPEWNTSGKKVPTELPYDPGSLDLVVVLGVLYHQDFTGAAEILHRSGHLIKHYGTLVCTAKLLNHHSMAHLSPDQYSSRSDKSWHASRERPLLDVAHPEEGFRRAMLQSRLQIREPVRRGGWATGGQPDLVTAVKV